MWFVKKKPKQSVLDAHLEHGRRLHASMEDEPLLQQVIRHNREERERIAADMRRAAEAWRQEMQWRSHADSG